MTLTLPVPVPVPVFPPTPTLHQTAPAARPPISPTPPLLRRSDLLAQGYSDNRIRHDLQEGRLTTLSPGVYVPGVLAGEMTTSQWNRAMLVAVVSRLAGDPVISHVSAAVLHDLPVAHPRLLPVHVIRPGTAKSRPGAGVYAHRATLRPSDRVLVGGLWVTCVARTVLDCALLLPTADAVPLARAALRDGLVTAPALADQFTRRVRVPGTRRARAVLELALSSGP